MAVETNYKLTAYEVLNSLLITSDNGETQQRNAKSSGIAAVADERALDRALKSAPGSVEVQGTTQEVRVPSPEHFDNVQTLQKELLNWFKVHNKSPEERQAAAAFVKDVISVVQTSAITEKTTAIQEGVVKFSGNGGEKSKTGNDSAAPANTNTPQLR